MGVCVDNVRGPNVGGWCAMVLCEVRGCGAVWARLVKCFFFWGGGHLNRVVFTF